MLTRTLLRFALLSLVAVCDAAGSQKFNYPADPKKVGANSEVIAQIDALLQSYVDEQKVSSAVGFVAKGGNVVYNRAFGWRDIENKIPGSVDDYYVLMSQTKAITTVAFMTLVEQGKVAIDDPVSKYFPEIPDRVVTKVNPDGTYETRPVKSPMTFVHLMSHTSGLSAGLAAQLRGGGPRPAASAAAATPSGPGQRTGGAGTERYLRDSMLALAKLPLGFDPGTQYSYHISSNMLAYMIERISGKSLREYVKETVLKPLGMSDTDWYYAPEALPRFVKAYRVANGKLEPTRNYYDATITADQTYAEGALGLNGPIADYAKFCQMLLNKGEFNGHRILKPETVEQMTTINRLLPETSVEQKGLQFGLGFEIHKTKKPTPAVSDSAFAWGGMLGTQYIVDPANDMVVLYYQNTQGSGPTHARFYERAYRLFDPPATPASATK